MNPLDNIANARAVVKLLLDMLQEATELSLTIEGTSGLFLLLKNLEEELLQAHETIEEMIEESQK